MRSSWGRRRDGIEAAYSGEGAARGVDVAAVIVACSGVGAATALGGA